MGSAMRLAIQRRQYRPRIPPVQYRALYHGLEEFERDTYHHVNRENDILFRRALCCDSSGFHRGFKFQPREQLQKLRKNTADSTHGRTPTFSQIGSFEGTQPMLKN
jgi:hypothetical protein